MIKRFAHWIGLSLLCAACATLEGPPPTVQEEAAKLQIASSFNLQTMVKSGVAILPVISETAPAGIRNEAAVEIQVQMTNYFPGLSLLSDTKTMETLRANDATRRELEAWLKSYRLGAPVDQSLLRRVGLFTNSRYLLLVQVDRYLMDSKPVTPNLPSLPLTGPVKSPSLSRPVVYDILKDIQLTGLLWDVECNKISWEGRGRVRVIDEGPDERFRMNGLSVMAARNFVSALFGAPQRVSEKDTGC